MSNENQTPERELTPVQKLFAQRITSREQLVEILQQAQNQHEFYPTYPSSTELYVHQVNYNKSDNTRRGRVHDIGWTENTDGYNSGDAWWLLREYMREACGLYPMPSETLRWLRTASGLAGAFFPHISQNDGTMVAYTPDHNSGVNDRQVKTTVGRLLRKLMPLLSAEQIAALEAEHRAEMSDDFLVATSIEEIEHVYNHMAGDSGCMRYGKSHWGHTQYHPSAVYAAPGMGVAYLKDTNDRVIARSVIFDNPDNPNDKRYVRLYGAHKQLESRLIRKGYKLGGLNGARLRALRDPSYDARFGSPLPDNYQYYVMPYLDSPGGGTTAANKGVYVVQYKDDMEHLVVVDESTRLSISAAIGGYDNVSYCQNTSGYTSVLPLERDWCYATCELTGERYDRTTESSEWFISDEGKLLRVRAKALTQEQTSNHLRRLSPSSGVVNAYISNEALQKFAVNTVVGQLFNDEATLTHFDIVKLSAKFYGEDAPLTQLGYTYDSEDGRILRSDATRVYEADDESYRIRYVHSSLVKAMRKNGYVALPTRAGVPSIGSKQLAEGDNPRMVKLRSGRHAILGVHDVVRLCDGTYDLRRNAQRFNMFGSSFYRVDGGGVDAMRMADSVLMDEFVTGCVENAWAASSIVTRNSATIDSKERDEVVARALCNIVRRGFSNEPAMLLTNGALAYVSLYSGNTTNMREFPSVVEAASFINAASDDVLVAMLGSGYYVTKARAWAVNAERMVELAYERLDMAFIAPHQTALSAKSEVEVAAEERVVIQVSAELDELFAPAV